MVTRISSDINDTSRLLIILSLNILLVVSLQLLDQKLFIVWNILDLFDFAAVNNFWELSLVARID